MFYRHSRRSVSLVYGRRSFTRTSPGDGSLGPNLLFLSPVPIITALLAWVEWRSLNDDSEIIPFVGGVGLFVSAYIGIAISLWPNIVPYRFSIWEAASSESTQAFLMVGTLFLLPIILMYSRWSYWVFRGKVRSDIGYH
jgi:cytochrome bd ubiquinol oxidase subunit II